MKIVDIQMSTSMFQRCPGCPRPNVIQLPIQCTHALTFSRLRVNEGHTSPVVFCLCFKTHCLVNLQVICGSGKIASIFSFLIYLGQVKKLFKASFCVQLNITWKVNFIGQLSFEFLDSIRVSEKYSFIRY